MKKIILVCGVLVLLCADISIADTTQGDGISPNDIQEPTIDIVFVIDTTGSMSDEIREVKMHITNLIEDIQQGTPKPNVTIGDMLDIISDAKPIIVVIVESKTAFPVYLNIFSTLSTLFSTDFSSKNLFIK